MVHPKFQPAEEVCCCVIWTYEVFISTREDDQVSFNVDALYKLLNDLQQVGTIHSTGLGNDCQILYKWCVVIVYNTGKVK